MTEAEWLACRDVCSLFEYVERLASARKARLLGCACVRKAWEWGLDEPAPEALHVAEAFVDAIASRGDMRRVAADMSALWREHDEPYRPYPRLCEVTEALVSLSRKPAWLGEIIAYANDMNIADEPEWLSTAGFVHDIFGNPFRPVTFSPSWRTDTAVTLARTMYESREFGAMPILADALQDAGCDNPDILAHCRDTSLTHVRGCWVTDLVLDKA